MVHLSDKKCVACEGGGALPAGRQAPLGEKEIKEYMSELRSGWHVIGGKKIQREFKFKDFRAATNFVNKVADIAEAEGHHPDIYIFYDMVKIELSTHAIKGLSENDFIIAAKIDRIA
ncbi:MAG TPA: 4a-hydroxytetrahydrobiopterin dehydratase [Candidatus Paceibacterota bacterium]|nr:4a-hydroxytetrahydrobiopterin dehydratase [Candidatus Paceibacterota bacterium]